MKILNVVGARPNFVKIAPLLSEMRKTPGLVPLLVHTGQHYDQEMSDTFFRDLDIPRPDYHLRVKRGNSALQVGETIGGLEPVLVRERPDCVLVVGDVNSTLAGALTAVKLGIPVAHVEAGLRSFDRTMPEEINRVVTDAVSDLLFVSETSGVENLLREGRPRKRVFLVGNVMIDTLKRALSRTRGEAIWTSRLNFFCQTHTSLSRYAVLTLHRQGLVDDPVLFGEVWRVLKEIARSIPVIFPVHPRTRLRLRAMGCESATANGEGNDAGSIYMIPPLGYLEFLSLQRQAAFVLTDSGGVQEETTALGVPCLTLRDNTERPITVTHGTNRIVGLNPERIRRGASRLLAGDIKPAHVPKLWDGRAAERIVRVLCEYFPPGGGRHQSEEDSVTPSPNLRRRKQRLAR